MIQSDHRKEHEIDAQGQSVGRVASQVARILSGKHKPTFTHRVDAGDFVTVIHASKVVFTGKKLVQKDYFRHTMHPGGLRQIPMKHIFETDPAEVMRRAVYGMLPKNSFRDTMIKRLTIKN